MRVLLTGMSGTGKSTLVRALRDRGIAAIDTDDGWVVPHPDGGLRWDEPLIDELLDRADLDPLVIAGCEENMTVFLPRFDHVILLSVPPDVIVERLQARTGNPFGKSAQEQAKVLRDHQAVEPLLRGVADEEIDTRAPLADVVARVLEVIAGG